MYNTKEKRTIYMQKWRKQNPKKDKEISLRCLRKYYIILHNLKINGCAICGYDKCEEVLQFHHVNPEDKKFNIAVKHMGRKDLVDELNKCVLLCANCHKEIHAKIMIKRGLVEW